MWRAAIVGGSVVLALAAAAPAGAATASVDGDGVLRYTTTAGETSSATIVCDASSCTIDDDLLILPGSRCTGLLIVGAVRCTGVERRDVTTGAGDDELELRGPIGGTVALGAGDDRLDATAARGADAFAAGAGADQLAVRDGTAEDVGCGEGADSATGDGLDRFTGCEAVDVGRRLSVDDASAPEGGGVLRFSIRLSEPSALPVQVTWATRDGTATAPADYAAAGGTVTFAPLEQRRDVDVPLVDDGADEPAEALELVLSNPAGAPLGRAVATGTIVDDDEAPAPPPAQGGGGGGTGDGGSTGTGTGGTGDGGTGGATGGGAPPATDGPGAGGTPPGARPATGGPAATAAGDLAVRRCVVPSVKGLTVKSATRRLTRAGCRLARVQRSKARGTKRGRALRTDPKAGRTVTRGALVTLVVRR